MPLLEPAAAWILVALSMGTLVTPIGAGAASMRTATQAEEGVGGGGSKRAPGVTLVDATETSGLLFEHFLGSTGEFYFPEVSAAGAALLDADGDGDLDAYLLQGCLLDPEKGLDDARFPPKVPLPPRNRLFRNELLGTGDGGGALAFVDATEGSGAGDPGYAQGVATGDADNDGDLDLLVTNLGPDVFLRNRGDGTFADDTEAAGVGDPRWTSSATFFDRDRDGLLDLFVAAYAEYSLAADKACFNGSGVRDYCGPSAYPATPSRLYANRGGGRFVDVSSEAGVDRAYGHGLGVVAADLDQNGWLDLYVANDGDENQVFMNEEGRFTNLGLLSGASVNHTGKEEAGMGVVVEDYDEDGDPDLFLTHLTGETNTLYENLGGGFFADVTTRAKLGLPSRAMTGFGVAWADIDHDTDLDLFIANGAVYAIEALGADPHPYHQTNQVMLQESPGTFVDRSLELGECMALSEVSRGLAAGDVDNDGDVDFLVSNQNGPARLLCSQPTRETNWLVLRVLDGDHGRDAFGVVIRVTLEDGRVLSRSVRTDGSYCSAGDPRVHFGWPAGVGLAAVEAVWPGGRVEEIPGVAPRTHGVVTLAPTAGDEEGGAGAEGEGER